MKNIRGITLISLVITIIVLIISSVGIYLSLGENGIFNKAKYASEKYTNEQEKEETEIAKLANEIDGYVGGDRTTIVKKATFIGEYMTRNIAANATATVTITGLESGTKYKAVIVRVQNTNQNGSATADPSYPFGAYNPNVASFTMTNCSSYDKVSLSVVEFIPTSNTVDATIMMTSGYNNKCDIHAYVFK